MHAVLREGRVTLNHRWELGGESAGAATEGDDDPFALQLPTLLLANKADGLADADVDLRALVEITGLRYPARAVSATTGQGLAEIGPWLFGHLGIVRVSDLWSILFLAVGVGAILQVAYEVLRLIVRDSRETAGRLGNFVGLILGLVIMYLTGLLVQL